MMRLIYLEHFPSLDRICSIIVSIPLFLPFKTQYPINLIYIHDAKYLRLKSIELGYTIKRLRVYISGNNLFVLSPFKYWDPEKGSGHGLSYPLQRTAKIGVQYQF